jgi:hypothetical protein
MLCALAARAISSPLLKWRHHGIGLLQAYLVEGHSPDTETRIHVWHPTLRLADMDDSGLMHDHRFDLESRVLLGAMHDTEIALTEVGWTGHSAPDDLNPFVIWEVQNARAKEESGEGWVKPEVPRRYYRLERISHVYSAGSTYHYPRKKFHRSDVDELTVTLCTKRNQSSSPARLLARLGAIPEHAFKDAPDKSPDFLPAAQLRRESLIQEAATRLVVLARGS